MDSEDLGLPRVMMGAFGEVSEGLQRCFRVLVMPEYLPLESVNSPEELQQIFIDTVTGESDDAVA